MWKDIRLPLDGQFSGKNYKPLWKEVNTFIDEAKYEEAVLALEEISDDIHCGGVRSVLESKEYYNLNRGITAAFTNVVKDKRLAIGQWDEHGPTNIAALALVRMITHSLENADRNSVRSSIFRLVGLMEPIISYRSENGIAKYKHLFGIITQISVDDPKEFEFQQALRVCRDIMDSVVLDEHEALYLRYTGVAYFLYKLLAENSGEMSIASLLGEFGFMDDTNLYDAEGMPISLMIESEHTTEHSYQDAVRANMGDADPKAVNAMAFIKGLFPENTEMVFEDNFFGAAIPTGEVTEYNHYRKDIRLMSYMDIYRTCAIFGVDDKSGAIHHSIKKLLATGVRGVKGRNKDLKESLITLIRGLEEAGIIRAKGTEKSGIHIEFLKEVFNEETLKEGSNDL